MMAPSPANPWKMPIIISMNAANADHPIAAPLTSLSVFSMCCSLLAGTIWSSL